MKRITVVLATLTVVSWAGPPAEAQPGNIILASTSDTGIKGDRGSNSVSVSGDGATVAFSSGATNLDPADTDTSLDVYVKDPATGDITLASTSDEGVKGNSASIHRSLSADGSVLAFMSFATNLDPADTDGHQDVYVKNLSTGEITLASTTDEGVKGDNASVQPSLSADGSVLAFMSYATNLDPADTDTVPDIYVKDLDTGDVTLASVSDARGKGNDEAPSRLCRPTGP